MRRSPTTAAAKVRQFSPQLSLTRGWHDFTYFSAIHAPVLQIARGANAFTTLPDGILRDGYDSVTGTIEDLTTLAAAQTDLKYLSLRGNVISDVLPLTQLTDLEILDLQNNAVKNLEDLTGQRLIDNGDPDFSFVGGDWQTNLSPVASAFEGDYAFREGVTDETARRSGPSAISTRANTRCWSPGRRPIRARRMRNISCAGPTPRS